MSLTIENQANERDEDGDKISQLPEPILHHILSFLSQKDAARTCVLSKSWRYLWCARPVIDFYESAFRSHCFRGRCSPGHSYCGDCRRRNKETFMFVIDKTLKRYHDLKLSVHELNLVMSIDDSKVNTLLLKWIPKLIIPDMRLKSFNLTLYGQRSFSDFFDMPSILFKVESLQSLYLRRCKLSQINSSDEVLLKRLQTLTLDDVHITKETLEMILSSNPLLENVSLLMCKGFEVIRVCKPHGLKDVVIGGLYNPWLTRHDPRSIEIDIPTIERIRVTLYWFDHHKYLPHLTFLFLDQVALSKSIDFLSGKYLPCLQHLTLKSCYLPREFSLHLSGSVKHLYFIYNNNRMDIKAFINAPNIVLFVYKSEISDSAISFTTTSSEWKSKITVNVYTDVAEYNALLWFRKLSELLHEFSRSEISFKLNQLRFFEHCRSEDHPSSLFESVHADIDQKLRHEHKPILEVEHFSLGGDYSYSSLPAFLNCLFRIFHPRYIEQHLYFGNELYLDDWSNNQTELTEFLMHMFLIKEKNMSFWPQGLEEVTMVEDFEKHAQRLDGMEARFQLEWENCNSYSNKSMEHCNKGQVFRLAQELTDSMFLLSKFTSRWFSEVDWLHQVSLSRRASAGRLCSVLCRSLRRNQITIGVETRVFTM
ncbi:hypothetical protein CASFOL_026949 [Castilleja foliolosa]|uniref:F-box domain-containing protein n=1 Tax=Castilleja foliolosa TaxID=1961234 RepID=A0ABD3CJG3_9LAMI